MKKTPEYNTILHICRKNYDQMMHGSWDLLCDERAKRRKGGWMEKWHIEVGTPPENEHQICIKIRNWREPDTGPKDSYYQTKITKHYETLLSVFRFL